jgi:hypothetical protein
MDAPAVAVKQDLPHSHTMTVVATQPNNSQQVEDRLCHISKLHQRNTDSGLLLLRYSVGPAMYTSLSRSILQIIRTSSMARAAIGETKRQVNY